MIDDKPVGTIPADKPRHGSRAALIAAGLIAATVAGAGATALVQKGRAVTLVALTPQPVGSLKGGEAAAVKGDVAETFGNKFVMQDGSGRALIETGPRGAGSALVTKGETITVQGRLDDGFMHAQAITHADGHVDSLDPPPPPPPGVGPLGAPRPPA